MVLILFSSVSFSSLVWSLVLRLGNDLEGGRTQLQGFLSNNVISDEDETIIEIQQRALDGIVNVNSLFTIAVFVGLAFASPGQHSLENKPECDADSGVAKSSSPTKLFPLLSFSYPV